MRKGESMRCRRVAGIVLAITLAGAATACAANLLLLWWYPRSSLDQAHRVVRHDPTIDQYWSYAASGPWSDVRAVVVTIPQVQLADPTDLAGLREWHLRDALRQYPSLTSGELPEWAMHFPMTFGPYESAVVRYGWPWPFLIGGLVALPNTPPILHSMFEVENEYVPGRIVWSGLLMNVAAFGIPPVMGVLLCRSGYRRLRRRRGQCIECGYDLRGCVCSCPECGVSTTAGL
jgi:hypothetical protein